MNHDDIERLWFQALHESVEAGEPYIRHRFAALVEAAERERVNNVWLIVVDAAVQAEREACIRLVESEAECYSEPVWALEIVSDIRARGEK